MIKQFFRTVLLVLYCCLSIQSAKISRCSKIAKTPVGYPEAFTKFSLEIPVSYSTDKILTTVHVSGPEEAKPFIKLSPEENAVNGYTIRQHMVEVSYVLEFNPFLLPPRIVEIDIGTVDQCILYCKGKDYRPNTVYFNVSDTFNLIGLRDAVSPSCTEYKPTGGHFPENCGVRISSDGFSGEVARGSWPWLVPIYIRKNWSFEFKCGASIITSRTVLTAAHCLTDRRATPVNPQNVFIFAGRHNLSNFNEGGYTSHYGEQIVIHPNYMGGHQHDIALINLNTEIEFTHFAKPVCVSSNTAPVENKIGVVAGWGIKEGGLPSRVPYFVETMIVHPHVCGNSSEEYGKQNLTTTICAGNLERIGPCHGDSGGGLILLDSSGKYSLRGLVSLTVTEAKEREVETQQCDPRKKVLYTDVAKYYHWISSEMW